MQDLKALAGDDKNTKDDTKGGVKADNPLSKFAKSDFTGMKQVVKFVKDGAKLDNAAMQELLYFNMNRLKF